ncbi:hypothetical protein DUT90_08610 [Polaribacter sp. WD7]|uniref:leucine-rich repeat domain-containing protein n=1 Tax=Polaribacter sp. WD7 TaxID=2269061 RepID=UPI000DF1C549|nr:hypothetical protein [Polaribacter sp. WD7]RCS27156.1 hypothetical protein DUT90_08610 [Polaribacter sp. WD7]
MIKQFFFLVILVLFQGCKTYKRSFGITHTNVLQNNVCKTYRLDLSNQNLNEVPKGFYELQALKMLNISGNKKLNLETVFQQIQRPEKLEVLILDSLDIKELPKNIQRFVNLKHLSLNNNPLLDLEKTFELVKFLPISFLNLQHNNLTTITTQITKLSSLKAINLSHNQITSVETYQNLGKLSSLKSLWLNYSQLQNLPNEIGEISSLKNLYLEHNFLKDLPKTIKKLLKLNVFHVGHNNFDALPIQLIHMPKLILLHINNCKIKTISNDFATSKISIKGIVLNNNQLSSREQEKWKKEFSAFFIASF